MKPSRSDLVSSHRPAPLGPDVQALLVVLVVLLAGGATDAHAQPVAGPGDRPSAADEASPVPEAPPADAPPEPVTEQGPFEVAPEAETAPTTPAAPAGATALPGADGAHGPVVHAALGQGFQLVSADGRQSLRLAALLSARAGVRVDEGEDPNWFSVVRLGRIALTGNLAGSELTYFFQGEFAGTPQLLDVELAWTPMEQLRVRFGRMRVPFGRQWITGLNTQMLPDRSVVSDLFRPGRDTGVTVESYLLDGKIELRAGAYAESGDRWPRVAARAAFAPLGAVPYSEDLNAHPGPTLFQIGVSGAYDKRVLAAGGPDADRTSGGVDLAFRAGPFAAFAEGYVERRYVFALPAMGLPSEGALAAGMFAQAGVFVLPGRLQLYGRFDTYAQDIRNTGSDGLRRYEAGVGGYFFDTALRVQARYAYDDVVGAPLAAPPPFGVLPPPQGHVADVQFVLAL